MRIIGLNKSVASLTDTFDLRPVQIIEEIVYDLSPISAVHLLCAPGKQVYLRPESLDFLAVSPTDTVGIIPQISELTGFDMPLNMKLANEDKKIDHPLSEVRRRDVETLHELNTVLASNIIRKCNFDPWINPFQNSRKYVVDVDISILI